MESEKQECYDSITTKTENGWIDMVLDKRGKSSEHKYSIDQHTLFRIEARASKLIGLWAAGEMGLTGVEADNYAKEVVAANLDEPGYDDVKRKLRADFEANGYDCPEHILDTIIEKKALEAQEQILSESKES